MRSIITFGVLGLAIPRAHADRDHGCNVGVAAGGALVGGVVGSTATLSSFALAGADINDPAHATRDSWIIGSAVMTGTALGPVASCAAFDREPHAIPTATFVIAGAELAGAALGVGWFAFSDWRDRRFTGSQADRDARAEGAAALGALLIVVGGAAGGVGGYYLHRHVFPRGQLADVAIAPLAARDVAGLAVAGRF
jgi:hypothetical protein